MKNLLFIIFFLFFTKEALSEDHYLCAFDYGFILGENNSHIRLKEPFLFKYRLVIDKGYISSDMYFEGRLIGKIKKNKSKTDGQIILNARNERGESRYSFFTLNRELSVINNIEDTTVWKSYDCRKD